MSASQNIQIHNNANQEVVEFESPEVPPHHMQGMHVLGDAVSQQEFLTDQVIFQELSGSKALAEMQAHLTDLSGGHQQVLIPQNIVNSLNQTIQSEHAYPISQPEDIEEEEEQEGGIKAGVHEQFQERKKERILGLLEDIESYIVQTYPDVLTILMEDPDEKPFLSVSSKYPDKFLHDQSSLRLNIRQGTQEWLSCQLLTYNREVVRQADIKNIKTDVGVIIEDMIGDRYQYCNGLTFKEEDNFSQKIKKSDIQHILIEKYNGKVFYRSKDCKFIVDNNTNSLNANSESRNHCPECRIFTSTIFDRFGSKNLEDFVVPDNETEQEFSKKKRGRPKGSRKRLRENESDMKEESHENDNSIFEGLAELRVGDVEANLGNDQIVENQMDNSSVKNESKRFLNDENEGNDDFAMEDNPSDDDYDINSFQLPKRGKRRKILSKKFLENKSEEVIKPGPGRKPKTPTPILCSEEGCQESCETVSAFKAHLQGHVGTFVCSEDTCIKRFSSKEDALNHQKKHMGEKPYTCSECKKEYATKQDLKLHFRKHTGEKPFPCDMCGKEFARKAALRIHKISVHTNLKSYLCADCGAAFKANSALIDHKKRVHLQIKPHRCEYCGKEFFSKKDYGEHTRTHTGEKPFQCQLCGKCFGRGYHLKRHTDGVHRHPGLLGPDGNPLPGVQISESGTLTMTPQSPGQGGGGLTIDSFPNLSKKSSKKSKAQGAKAPARPALVTTANISFSESQSVPTFALSLPQGEDTKQLIHNQVDIKPMLPLDEKPFSDIKLYDRAPLDLAQRTSQQLEIEAGQGVERSDSFDRSVDSPLRNNLEIHETRESPRSQPSPGSSSQPYTTYTVTQPTYIVGNFYRSENSGGTFVDQTEVNKIYKL